MFILDTLWQSLRAHHLDEEAEVADRAGYDYIWQEAQAETLGRLTRR